MPTFELISDEDRLAKWREAEQAAAMAERYAASIGQAAESPEVRDIFLEATNLRDEAERQFAALPLDVKLDEPRS
jgi:hypothetical protein